MKKRAEEYMQQQRTQRETLDELRISCQQFLQDNHVVKIIEEKEDRIEQLNQAVKMELDSSPMKGFQDVDLVASELNIKSGVGYVVWVFLAWIRPESWCEFWLLFVY